MRTRKEYAESIFKLFEIRLAAWDKGDERLGGKQET
jgi:hypothetical protein